MPQDFIKPEKPSELIADLTTINRKELDEYTKRFPKEILEFSEAFSDTFKLFLELERQVVKLRCEAKGVVTQADYVQFFTYQFLDNLYSSMKLMLLGFQVASGNLLRQTAEGVAVAVLCSIDYRIKRKIDKKKTKSFKYFESFVENKEFARSYKAIDLLDLNKDLIGFSEYGIELLKLIKNLQIFIVIQLS